MNDSRPSPDEDALRATEALREGDLAHAMYHMSWAIFARPASPEFRTLMIALLRAAPDPLALTEPSGDISIAQAAARAFTHHWLGQLDDALDLLRQVLETGHGFALLAWPQRWFADTDAFLDVEVENISALLSVVVSRMSGDRVDDPARATLLDDTLPWVERACEHFDDAMLNASAAMLLRKRGHHARALELAMAAYRLWASGYTAMGVGLVHSALGDVEGHLEWFRRAAEHDPDNPYIRLDLGDILCDRQEFEEGMAWYGRALDIDPEQPWALAHLAFHQVRAGVRVGEALDTLYALHRSGNEHALGLLQSLSAWLGPWEGWLPAPAEASVRAMESAGEDGLETLTLSSLEAASAMWLCAQHLPGPHALRVLEIQDPDPRSPRSPVTHLLWVFDDILPRPRLPEPSERVRAHITGLADAPFLLAWWRWRAGRLDLSAQDIPELLATMTSPGPPPETSSPWEWLHRVQVAAAVGLSTLGAPGREALLDLARGPMDWSVTAAAVMLTELALEQQEQTPERDEVLSLLLTLAQDAPRPGYVPYFAPVLRLLTRFQELPEPTREECLRVLRVLEAVDARDEEE